MSGTTCIAIGVLSTASSRVTTYFTKKKPGNDVANSAVVSKASSWLGVFPSVRRMRSSIVRFLVCLGTAKIKTAVLECFVALSFKFHLLKKYK